MTDTSIWIFFFLVQSIGHIPYELRREEGYHVVAVTHQARLSLLKRMGDVEPALPQPAHACARAQGAFWPEAARQEPRGKGGWGAAALCSWEQAKSQVEEAVERNRLSKDCKRWVEFLQLRGANGSCWADRETRCRERRERGGLLMNLLLRSVTQQAWLSPVSVFVVSVF